MEHRSNETTPVRVEKRDLIGIVPTYDVYASQPNVVSLKAMFKTLASEPKNCHAPTYRNNYEILKMLLDRGATIPIPHDVKCSCDDCVIGSTDDSLKFSLARINAYRFSATRFLKRSN